MVNGRALLWWLGVCVLGALPGLTVGCAASERHNAVLEAAAQSQFEAGIFHGGIVCADGETVLYRAAFGDADRITGRANTPGSAFPIQSITKSFTAIIVLQLVEEDRLRTGHDTG